MKTLTQDRDNIQLLYEQATDEIQRLRRQVSQARSPSPSRAASAVLARVEAERDSASADVRRVNMQLDNLEDKLKVCSGKYFKKSWRNKKKELYSFVRCEDGSICRGEKEKSGLAFHPGEDGP